MKIIDLLVKISKDEKMPKKIKYGCYIWKYDKDAKDYYRTKINEESFEVIEAVVDLEEQILTRCECGCSECHTKHEREHLEEEIADALVLLNQFIYYYDLNEDNIMDTVYKKTDREIDRIANKLKIEGVTDESGRD